AYPTRNSDGKHIQAVVVTFTDISQRKQTEAALVASEERWKFAIEGAGDGLWDWNIQTGQAYYSPRYKAMLDFAEEEVGETADEWTKRIHPDDAPGVYAALQPYLDGMPGSAIATGLVDFVLAPAEMPAQLIAYSSHAFGNTSASVSTISLKAGNALKKLFILLRAQTGHDFTHYKPSTVHRRVERRMAVQQIETVEEYCQYAQQSPPEVDALFRDLLIGVTSFFRDPQSFKVLEEKVIPGLFANKSADTVIRVWCPACSTGEEAYSIAILLNEHMERIKQYFTVQVFATDIDSKAIEKARSGVFPASIAADLSPERFTHFFTPEPDSASFRIQKGIRDMLIFSEHDVIKDPPFSKLDLISCRNLLIYLDGELQKRLIPLFHFALNSGGFLFLGTSEGLGDCADFFTTLDRGSKLFQRIGEGAELRVHTLGGFPMHLTDSRGVRRHPAKFPGDKSLLRDLTERALLQRFTPVGALVNGYGDILYLHGRTGLYLEPAPGEAVMNILKMAREGLRRDLTTALHLAVLQKEPVYHPGVRVKTNGHYTTIDLTVRPVRGEPGEISPAILFLVVMEEIPEADQGATGAGMTARSSDDGSEVDLDAQVVALKQDLQAKEDYLLSTNEELETANQDLRSSNEEMQSVNEELQSTNEELETAKEELQSVNEELFTVNAQLQTKLVDLSQSNNDMNNLLAGTGVGTIFVDHMQRIKRFTPASTEIINLIPSDVGRSIGHIVSNLAGYDRLVEDVKEVLETLEPKAIEVQTKAGSWHLLGIRPYRTLENVVEWATITFVDINNLKTAQEMMLKNEALKNRLGVVVHDSRDAVIARDLEGRILAWNPAAERMYGWSEAEALKMNIRDMIPEGRQKESRKIVEQLSKNKLLEPYRMQRLTKEGRIVEVVVTATVLLDKSRNAYAIATTERDAVES
ncbi:MAG: CheR family methyltransferase, partial [Verrucomicrobiota bacterium]